MGTYKGKVANQARNAPLCVVGEGLTDPSSKFHAYPCEWTVHTLDGQSKKVGTYVRFDLNAIN